jgi:branched-chain amino acid transport system substrate-binding protein
VPIPDNTKRIAQELIVNDKVQIIAGFGITPAALAAAPLATQAKIPEIVMLAGASIVTERSPYIVRTSFTLAQSAVIIGDWAPRNGIRKVATLTSDYAPGNDALQFFKARFTAAGGEIVEEVKVPLMNPDFAPFLQRMKDARPDAMFVFVPGGQGGNFMKQYSERGLDKSGIRIIGPATSWTTTCSTTWAMPRSAPSPRTCTRQPILPAERAFVAAIGRPSTHVRALSRLAATTAFISLTRR